MALTPIDRNLNNNCCNLRLIATDMDGTLTQKGKFTASLLQAFAELNAANIAVLIVTGRSAGWVSGLVSYLPIFGAIAENGGIFYPASGEAIALTPILNLDAHRRKLAQAYQQLQSEFSQLRESSDNRFRLTDWTFDNRNLSVSQLEQLEQQCLAMGWGFTYSSVQCHIKAIAQDKAIGLRQVLTDYFPDTTPQQVLTVGDSPNDASLFNPELFQHSVGVANVLDYANELTFQPKYVTQSAEGEGFCELVRLLLSL